MIDLIEKLFKGGLAVFGTILTYMSGNFTPLIWLLILAELGDYLSGLYSAWNSGNLSSKEAINGFFKKLFYFFLVAVGFSFDYMIYWLSNSQIGITFDYPACLGILSVCYLLSTELISITENLEKIGLHIPFVTKALKAIKGKIEQKAEGDEKNERNTRNRRK